MLSIVDDCALRTHVLLRTLDDTYEEALKMATTTLDMVAPL